MCEKHLHSQGVEAGSARQNCFCGLLYKSVQQREPEGESEVAQSCPTLRPHGLEPTRLPHPWNFLGRSTGVGCRFLLQGIFPTQGSNPGLPHCR